MARRKKLEEMSFKELEKVADRDFSKFIRLRDSDIDGYVKCCTCDSVYHWKELDCGHFIKRNIRSTRFHEKNCNAQCKSCNNFGKGEEAKHKEYIDLRYGQGVASSLRSLKNGIKIYTKADYIGIIYHYRYKWKSLLKDKNK
jgi:hypothetical protein